MGDSTQSELLQGLLKGDRDLMQLINQRVRDGKLKPDQVDQYLAELAEWAEILGEAVQAEMQKMDDEPPALAHETSASQTGQLTLDLPH